MLENDPKINKEVSPTTFNNHLKRLEKEKIIVALDKDSWKRGQKRFYTLTKPARDKMVMGTLKFNFNDDKNFIMQEKEEIIHQTFYKVLCIIGLKLIPTYTEPKQDNDDKKMVAELLDIVNEISGKPRKIKISKRKRIVGVSVDDILNNMSGLLAFWHVVPNRNLVENTLDILIKKKIVNQHKLNGIERYSLSKSLLKNYISDCIQIFFGIGLFRLRYIWQHIRSPTKLENDYFFLYFPNSDFNDKIKSLKKTLSDNKDRLEKLRCENAKEYTKQKKNIIYNNQFWDYQLSNSIKLLKHEHLKVFEKYPGIADMLFEIFFPKFLISDIETTNAKYKNMRFPKLILNSNILGTKEFRRI